MPSELENCLLCDREVGNLFEHLRIQHLIKTPEQYQSELAKVDASKALQREQAKFIEELNSKKAKGLISGEEWRQQAEKWRKDHLAN
jgi:hypothetical protein